MGIISDIKSAIDTKLDENTKNRIRERVAGIQDKADTASIIIGAKKDKIVDTARKTYHAARDGYIPSEAWNFGDYTVVRAANILAALRAAQYEETPSYFDELEYHENVFRAVGLANSSAFEALHLSLVERDDALHLAENALDGKFAASWQWYLDTILNDEVYVAPKSAPATLSGAVEDLRARVECLPTAGDLANLPSGEKMRMSKLLQLMAKESHGHPCEYVNSPYAMKTFEERGGESWAKGQSLAMGLLTHTDKYWREFIWEKTENGNVRQKTREQLGLSWIAWNEDILYASDVLAEAAVWDAPMAENEMLPVVDDAKILTKHEYLSLLDEDIAARADAKLDEELQRVWTWIGKNIFALWD